MKILITGGAGFIGSALCKRLLQEGNEIWCLDNFSTGCMANIEGLMGNPRFHLLKQDVIEPVNVPVEQIYNMALFGQSASLSGRTCPDSIQRLSGGCYRNRIKFLHFSAKTLFFSEFML